jgi:F0F1-type ATP synthase assembly protein I
MIEFFGAIAVGVIIGYLLAQIAIALLGDNG